MANIADLLAVLKETREIEKGIAPSTVSGNLQIFNIGVPGVTVSRFSLPSRCFWVGFVSPSTSILGAPISCASGNHFWLVKTTGQINEFNGRGGPLDLSDFCVTVSANNSGTTLTAFVQAAAPLAS